MYYRFWKKIGKGNWKKYQERYMRPQGIENQMRLVFPFAPRFKDAKASASWNWMLPKQIARATMPGDVLNSWAFFRHKNKKVYHYAMALRRLTDLGGCSTNDWRYKLITSRIVRHRHRFLNLPRIGTMVAKLGDQATLETFTPFFLRRLPLYNAQQLSMIADSHAKALLFDRTLMNRVCQEFNKHIPSATVADLNRMLGALATMRYFRMDSVGKIASELVDRLATPQGEKMLLPGRNGEPRERLPYEFIPSLNQLTEAAAHCATLRHQPRDLLDLVTVWTRAEVQKGNASPLLLAKVAATFSAAKVAEQGLFDALLSDVAARAPEYPPDCLLVVLQSCLGVLPISHAANLGRYGIAFQQLRHTQAFRMADLARALEVHASIQKACILSGENVSKRKLFELSEASRMAAEAFDLTVKRVCFYDGTDAISFECLPSRQAGGSGELGPATTVSVARVMELVARRVPLEAEIKSAADRVKEGMSEEKAALAEERSRKRLGLANAYKGALRRLGFGLEGQIDLMEPQDFLRACKAVGLANQRAGVRSEQLVQRLGAAVLEHQDEFTGAQLNECMQMLTAADVDYTVRVRLRGIVKEKGADSHSLTRTVNKSDLHEESLWEKSQREHLVGPRKTHFSYESESANSRSPTKDALPDSQRTVFIKTPRKYN